MQEGPLDNPEWTEEQNRQFDKLDGTFSAAAARRIVFGKSDAAEDLTTSIESPITEEAPATKIAKPKPKRPINSPSRNHKIYDRDKTVESIYGKRGEL